MGEDKSSVALLERISSKLEDGLDGPILADGSWRTFCAEVSAETRAFIGLSRTELENTSSWVSIAADSMRTDIENVMAAIDHFSEQLAFKAKITPENRASHLAYAALMVNLADVTLQLIRGNHGANANFAADRFIGHRP